MDFSNPRDMEIAVDDPKDQKGLRRIKYDPNWYDKNHKGRLSTCSLAVANFALFVFAIWLIDKGIHSRRSEEIDEYYKSLTVWKSTNIFTDFS